MRASLVMCHSPWTLHRLHLANFTWHAMNSL